jgi:hypothetical protein
LLRRLELQSHPIVIVEDNIPEFPLPLVLLPISCLDSAAEGSFQETKRHTSTRTQLSIHIAELCLVAVATILYTITIAAIVDIATVVVLAVIAGFLLLIWRGVLIVAEPSKPGFKTVIAYEDK